MLSTMFSLAETVVVCRLAFDIKSQLNAPLLKMCGETRKRFGAVTLSGAKVQCVLVIDSVAF